MKILLWFNGEHGWRWALHAENGEQVAVSPWYPTEQACRQAIRDFQELAPIAPVVEAEANGQAG